jgi:hypothetical protein
MALTNRCVATADMRDSIIDLKRIHQHRPNGGISVAPRASRLVVVLLAVAGLCPETAWAKPEHATFEKMVENSATIVVARFLGDQPDEKKATIQVEVTQVLKGDLKPGKHHFAFEDRPHFGAKGEEFVAFLDKDRVWRFMASPQKGENKVSQGVLQISGFYDFNAYYVTPGLVTLEQLKTYVKDGTLAYRFRGNVYFPEIGKEDWKPGSFVVSGSYDAINKKVDLHGLPNLKSFPAQPEVDIQSGHHFNIRISYRPNKGRELRLIGQVRGIDTKTGEMNVRFAVSIPEVLTKKAFEDYLTDASKGTCYYRFKLTCAPTKDSTIPNVIFLTIGKSTADQPYSPQLEGLEKTPLCAFRATYSGPTMGYGSSNSAPRPIVLPKTVTDEGSNRDWVYRITVKTNEDACLTLGFEVGEPTKDECTFSDSFLLYPLYRNQTKGTITLHDGKTAQTVATFTTTLDSVGFNHNQKK